jgi:hypothetical protein
MLMFKFGLPPIRKTFFGVPLITLSAARNLKRFFVLSVPVMAIGFSPASAQCPPVPSTGANTPFITYEAEAGTVGGGASVVTLSVPSTTEFSSPALEASGHAYVQLTAPGQYVQWTNNTCLDVTAVNIRDCIPDSAAGGGTTSTLDLYVNGVFNQAVTMSSTQTWVYETASSYNGMSQSPSAGTPHVFWDESRVFLNGPAVAPGDTLMLKVDAANTANFYYIDCVDLEAPPAPLAPPANSLSIASYGAQPNNPAFDNTGDINNCLSAAQSAGKTVWIPSGTYYCSGGVLNATDVTVAGAGPWYSTVVDNSTSWSNGFFFLAHGASFQNLCIDATYPDATPGLFAILAYGSTNNPGWTLNNVWARHTMLTWGTGVGILIENCRINNSFGDGMNINNTNGTACGNVTVTNNFARGNGDDGITLNSSNTSAPVMTNCTYTHNTSVASWWADNMGIYGGTGVTVEYNDLHDSVKLNGMLVGIFGNGGGSGGGNMNQALIMNNSLERCGSLGYGNKNPGLSIGGAQGGSPPAACAGIVVSGNTITNPMFDGIDFNSGGVSETAQYNTITSPGGNGIGEGNTGNTNTIICNTVTGLKTGMSAYVNNDGNNVLAIGAPAASYSGENSVIPETCAEGGQDIGTISNGSYTYYTGVAMTGFTTFYARVASAGVGGNIQVRLDSPTGTVVGTCAVPVTGGWQTWITESCAITPTTGTHTVYLVYTGGAGNLFNVEWVTLPGVGCQSTVTPSIPTPTNTPTATASPTVTKTASLTTTNTPTLTSSYTFTRTPTNTTTSTSSYTFTQTPTITSIPVLSTATFTGTTTPGNTHTPTMTYTGTLSPTSTMTLIFTFTKTPTPTGTYTNSVTSTVTQTSSFTPTVTTSATHTPIFTGTTTNTLTNTPAIPTSSPTGTSTKTNTVTPTPILTSTATLTSTNSFTATRTATPTLTYTFTLTKTVTATSTGTNTSTWTSTPKVPTATFTFTVTPTYTHTAVLPTSTPTSSSACSDVPAWNGNFVAYSIGQKVSYNGELYQCIQAHTSELNWMPPVVPALWKDLGPCGSTPTAALVTANPVVYPNPATSSTTSIQLPVTDATNVTVEIYTVSMRQVRVFNVPQVAGNTLIVSLVDKGGVNLANGLYYFIIKANEKKWMNKILVLR